MALTKLLRAVSKRRKNAFNACMQLINCKVRPIKIDENFFLKRVNYYAINSIDRIVKVFDEDNVLCGSEMS